MRIQRKTRFSKPSLCILSCLLATIGASTPPPSQILRVSKNAAADQPGIHRNTIGQALSDLEAAAIPPGGIVVLVSPGVYEESVVLDKPGVRLVGTERGSVIIRPGPGDGSTPAAPPVTLALPGGSTSYDMVLDSLTLDAVYPDQAGLVVSTQNLPSAEGVEDIALRHCTIRSRDWRGIHLAQPIRGLYLDDCDVSSVMASAIQSGLYVTGSSVSVRGGTLSVGHYPTVSHVPEFTHLVIPAVSVDGDLSVSGTRFADFATSRLARPGDVETYPVTTSLAVFSDDSAGGSTVALDHITASALYEQLQDTAHGVTVANCIAQFPDFDWGDATFLDPGAQTASAQHQGYLSSADWSTFNAKEPALPSAGANPQGMYLRGDKTFASFDDTLKSLLGESSDYHFLKNDGTVSVVNGTVDNSPVGATTASTGRFTTLTATTSTNLTAAPLQGASPLVLEGSTVDANRTTLAVAEPTASRTITIPNASGTVAVSATAPLAIDADGNLTVSNLSGTNSGDLVLASNADAFLGLSGQQLSADSQSANRVLASPDGASGVPTFRALTDADVPNALTVASGSTINASPINASTIGATTPSSGVFTSVGSNASKWIGLSQASAVVDSTLTRTWDADRGFKIGFANVTNGTSGWISYPVTLRPGDIVTAVKVYYGGTGTRVSDPDTGAWIYTTMIQTSLCIHHDWAGNGSTTGYAATPNSVTGPTFNPYTTPYNSTVKFYAESGSLNSSYTVVEYQSLVLRLYLQSEYPTLWVNGVAIQVTHREL